MAFKIQKEWDSLYFICHYLWQSFEIYSRYSPKFAMKIGHSATLNDDNLTNFRCLRIFNGKKQKAIKVIYRSNASPILIGVIMQHRCNCPFIK